MKKVVRLKIILLLFLSIQNRDDMVFLIFDYIFYKSI